MRGLLTSLLASVIGLTVLITAPLACAQEPMPAPAVAPGFNPEAFGRWADEKFAEAYAQGDAFSGMGLVVVSGDQVVVRRAYGFADSDARTRIDPAKTRFLIGSISKTFVGVAIAQLVERGVIRSIDDPANTYLKRLKIQGFQGADVTLRDLLTHSAGYDQRVGGVGTPLEVAMPLSGRDIAALAPRLVRPPGGLVSYSNYSTGLLAIIVEDQTGIPIEQYLREQIWTPLGMSSAGFQKGLTLSADVAAASKPDGAGGMKPAPFLPFHPFYWPVGAIGASLDDMARYAQFHLAASRGQTSSVLSAASHAQLRAIQHRSHPDVGGFGFQMMSFDWNGEPVFGHGGTWPGYESMLLVFPQRDVAVFFSITGPRSIGNLSANIDVIVELLGAYRPPRPVIAAAPQDLEAYVGLYRPALRSYSGPEALIGFFAKAQQVSVGEGGLMLDGEGPLRPIGRDAFYLEGARASPANLFGSPLFAFMRDDAGRVTHLVHLQGLAPLERVSQAQAPQTRMAILDLAKFAGLLGLLAVFWPGSRRRDRVAKGLVFASAPLAWAFPVILVVGLGESGLGGYLLLGGDLRFLAVACIGALLVIGALAAASAALGVGARDWWWRVHAGLCAAAYLVSGSILLSLFVV